MNRKANNSMRTMDMLRRRGKVRRDYLVGCRTARELAVRYGVSEITISKDLIAIREEFRKEYEETSRGELATSLAELHEFRVICRNAFVRSQESEEEITTSYDPRKCPDCKDGMVEGTDEWCERCDGTGKIIVEKVTRKVRGKAGDSSFLSAELAAMREENRLLGRYPHRNDVLREQRNDLVVIREFVSGMTPDQVIEVRRRALELQRLLEGKNGDVIDVESRDVKGNDQEEGNEVG